jgi:hypothetical protein
MIAAKTFKTADRFAFDVVQNLKSLERTARAAKRARKLTMKKTNRRAAASA